MSDEEQEQFTAGQQINIATAYDLAANVLSEDQISESQQLLQYARSYGSTTSLVYIEQLSWLIHGLAHHQMISNGVPKVVADEAIRVTTVLEKASRLETVESSELNNLGPGGLAVIAGYTDMALNPTMLGELDEQRRHNILLGFGGLRQQLLGHMSEQQQNSKLDQVLATMQQMEQRQDQMEQLISQAVLALSEMNSVVDGLAEQAFANADEDTKKAFKDEVKRRQNEVLEMLGGYEESSQE